IRSVVVVLPASICAAMPILRYFSRGVVRGIGLNLLNSRVALPSIVRERAVGFGHLVCVFALLDGSTAIVGGVEQLGREPLTHRLFVARACRVDDPADCECLTALGAD